MTQQPQILSLQTQELWPQLPALAERLGIKPNEGSGGLWLAMKDGTRYDIFALAAAFLDRIDEAEKITSTGRSS